MNGYAGLHQARRRRLEVSELRKDCRNLKVACADLVVGLAVVTDKINSNSEKSILGLAKNHLKY
jgi:hypothetical protein